MRRILYMFHFILKRTFRTLLRLIRDIDGLFSMITGIFLPREYKLIGKCKKRGLCCHRVGIQMSDDFVKYPKKIVIWWYSFVYNFQLIDERPEDRVLIFKCHYIKDNQCSIYHRRPFICRSYPTPRYFGKPNLIPGCGYSFQKK